MDYVIVNPSKKLFIRLDPNGSPVTCVKHMAERFEYSKAKNILENIPKSMRKFHFKVDAVPEIGNANVSTKLSEKKVDAIKVKHELPESLLQWKERFKDCADLVNEANVRSEELRIALSNADKELTNVLHEIELENWKDGCSGYKEYKRAKIILEKRRNIKDEMLIISTILKLNFGNLSSSGIDNIVNGLKDRTFSMREVDENL